MSRYKQLQLAVFSKTQEIKKLEEEKKQMFIRKQVLKVLNTVLDTHLENEVINEILEGVKEG